jgi:hypothetical protein
MMPRRRKSRATTVAVQRIRVLQVGCVLWRDATRNLTVNAMGLVSPIVWGTLLEFYLMLPRRKDGWRL